MGRTDLSQWRAETDVVDRLVDGLLARDGQAQAEAVRAIPDADGAHRRVWERAFLLLSWHAAHGPD
ncbi:hypothetical protein FV226_24505 [Methylobacterium sp. WL12]|uniref:hypothetical protein n=1 Tax=Methylobacterium sp. WL12 TaxID=2603890 RepID=UPI0011C7AAF5|nr:hypothetical protein [Methylobacterium sp. WL12]TXM65778.1 hypothetical protein FV226_24505 [Methylobacterium sp. WL12]